MAHADVFQRISRRDLENEETRFIPNRDTKKESEVNSKAIETIKLLGKQILEIREIIEQQTKTIKSLQGEVVSLKQRCVDTEGNLKLAIIDQHDVSKQLRALKSSLANQEYVDSRIAAREAYASVPRQIQQTTIQQPIIEPAPRAAIQQPRVEAKPRARVEESSAGEMNEAYQQITVAINQARTQLGLEPHNDLVGTIQKQRQAKPNNEVAKSMQAENAAKDFIFGRLPKMLNINLS